MVREKISKLIDLFLNVSFFLHFFQSLKDGSAVLLCAKIKLYPVLYGKKLKGYREKVVVRNAWWNSWIKDLQFIENGKMFFFMLYLG